MAWTVARTGPRGTRYKGGYRDPDGHVRSAGTFSTRREALRAAAIEEQKVHTGAWHDASRGEITFRDYVTTDWLPSKHVEATTKAGYRSNLDCHFYPRFGDQQLNRISPSMIQDWVTDALANGLSPRSIRKYHTMLSSIFGRAVKDRVLIYNPCDHTELPKVVTRRKRTLTPEEFDRLLAAIPDDHRLMVETLIEAGLRWGELVALKPRHIDLLRRSLTIEETIVEVSLRNAPDGQRYIRKPYPKDNEPRTFGVRQPWLDQVARQIVDQLGSAGGDEPEGLAVLVRLLLEVLFDLEHHPSRGPEPALGDQASYRELYTIPVPSQEREVRVQRPAVRTCVDRTFRIEVHLRDDLEHGQYTSLRSRP
jgi:integrase